MNMTVIINEKEYDVRHNYLHREVPRIVLEEKEKEHFVYVQLNESKLNPIPGEKYKGYWCVDRKYTPVIVTFKL